MMSSNKVRFFFGAVLIVAILVIFFLLKQRSNPEFITSNFKDIHEVKQVATIPEKSLIITYVSYGHGIVCPPNPDTPCFLQAYVIKYHDQIGLMSNLNDSQNSVGYLRNFSFSSNDKDLYDEQTIKEVVRQMTKNNNYPDYSYVKFLIGNKSIPPDSAIRLISMYSDSNFISDLSFYIARNDELMSNKNFLSAIINKLNPNHVDTKKIQERINSL